MDNAHIALSICIGVFIAGSFLIAIGAGLVLKHQWRPMDSCPQNVPVIVAIRSRTLIGGNGQAIHFPQQCRLAYLGEQGQCIDFTNGQPLLWAPDLWFPLLDIPPGRKDEFDAIVDSDKAGPGPPPARPFGV